MKRYKLLNNVLGWVVFVIAAVTYILTLESTASFWDCGEFIASGYKLEVGHPPGNPIFMLTARFFANFASSPSEVAYMVNLMSGLLSAATIRCCSGRSPVWRRRSFCVRERQKRRCRSGR